MIAKRVPNSNELATEKLPETSIKDLQLQHKKWHSNINTLECKMQGTVVVPGIAQLDHAKISMHVRIRKDSLIWVSFKTAFMNLEVLRILLSPTNISLFSPFINENRIRHLTYHDISSHYGIPMSFSEIQGIFLFHLPLCIEKEYKIDSTEALNVPTRDPLYISCNSTHAKVLEQVKLSIASDAEKCMPLLYSRKYTSTGLDGGKRTLHITQDITSNKKTLIAWQGDIVLTKPPKDNMSLYLRSVSVKENNPISTPFPNTQIKK